MRGILLSAAVAAIIFSGCCSDKEDATIATFKTISSQVKEEVAPDTRVKVYDFNLEKSNGAYVLKGKSNDINAKERLAAKLSENNIPFTDSTTTLPAAKLGEKTYGVAIQSVINFRTAAGYSRESATQVMAGTPLRLLEKQSYWTRAITPEGSIAWVTSGSLKEMTQKEMEEYTAAKKVIVTDKYVTITEGVKSNSLMVQDAVWGNILLDLGKQGNMHKVALADGREGYVPASSVEPFDKWISARNPTADNIIETAKKFIGVPYMWGGTSIKAVDCSGFTKSTYFLNGIILARDASQQCYTGDNIDISGYVNDNEYTLESLKELKKGDLIFFGTKASEGKKERITHVGIYIEDGIFIHSATSVRINSLIPTAENYYSNSKTLVRAQRILENQDKGKGIESISKSVYVK